LEELDCGGFGVFQLLFAMGAVLVAGQSHSGIDLNILE
jgi:hypothetical protein